MSGNRKVAVYIGSFDPFHNGHKEAVEIAHKLVGKVVLLPNNPRKGKPNRKSLRFRAHCLGKLYPLCAVEDWLKDDIDENDCVFDEIVVDTRDCDTILASLRLHGIEIVGVVGSDIVGTPKWKADRWIVIERTGFPVSFQPENAIIVSLAETKFQHLSSTLVRETRDVNAVPAVIVPYLFKQCETLSENVIDIVFSSETVEKTFANAECAQDVARRSALINSQRDTTPFFLAPFLSISGCVVSEKRIASEGTLADWIKRPEREYKKKMQSFLKMLMAHLATTTFLHGDLSVANVLCLPNDAFALIDYERVSLLDEKKDRKAQLQKEVARFHRSAAYYATLDGIAK